MLVSQFYILIVVKFPSAKDFKCVIPNKYLGIKPKEMTKNKFNQEINSFGIFFLSNFEKDETRKKNSFLNEMRKLITKILGQLKVFFAQAIFGMSLLCITHRVKCDIVDAFLHQIIT